MVQEPNNIQCTIAVTFSLNSVPKNFTSGTNMQDPKPMKKLIPISDARNGKYLYLRMWSTLTAILPCLVNTWNGCG